MRTYTPFLTFSSQAGGGTRATMKALLACPFFNLSTPLSLSEPVRSSPAFAHPEHVCQYLPKTILLIESWDSLLCVPHSPRCTVGSSQIQATCFSFLSNFANSTILPGLWQWCILMLPFPARPKRLRRRSALFLETLRCLAC